jgi:hypothetical protein
MDAWLCYLRHISLVSGVPFAAIKNIDIDDRQMQAITDRITEMVDGPYFKYEVSMEDPTPEFVESKIREYGRTKGKPDLVVIDYIGNMEMRNSSKDAKPWQRQGDAFEKLFVLAKRHRLAILTAQQVNRESIRENRKLKQEKKAQQYWQDAASGDQRIMHLSYYVIGLEPDKEQNIITYHPVKMRDATFDYFSAQIDPSINRIFELTPDKQEEYRKTQNPGGDVKEVKVVSTPDGDTKAIWGNESNIYGAGDMEIGQREDSQINDPWEVENFNTNKTDEETSDGNAGAGDGL